MTRYFISSLLFLVIAGCITSKAFAGNTQKMEQGNPVKESKATGMYQSMAGKTAGLPGTHPETPHGKTQAPHMEEVPHIHKFHKERLKKTRQHHSRYWLLSKLVLALCHLSILVIGYLHATH